MLRARIEKDFDGRFSVEASLDLEVESPRVAVLFGPSGAGKTTVLRCIAGLERPTNGRIAFGSEIWCDIAAGHWLPPQSRRVGFLFQDYALFPHLSVAGNIGYGIRDAPGRERRARVGDLARRLGLESVLDRYPAALSGGQRQRAALARALARRPRLLLLDEPFAALDGGTRDAVRAYLAELLSEFRVPAILVTHDWSDALALGHSMVVLKDGRVLQSGPPPEVLTRPAGTEAASIAGVETVQPGVRTGTAGGAVRLRVGSAEIVAVEPETGDAGFWVCIRGEDVMLETSAASGGSARNRLDGEVRDVVPKGPVTQVRLDVGFPLTALVTRQSALDLGLRPGSRIRAVFKASSVHLIPRR